MGSMDWTLLAGLLAAAFAVYFFVNSLLSGKADNSVLSWASEDAPAQSESKLLELSRPLVHNFTLKYAVMVKHQSTRESIEKKILTAGLGSELNVDEFIGFQILWGAFVPGFVAVMNISLGLGYPWFLLVAAVAFGLYYPHLYANGKRSHRVTQVQIDLPFFTDLLALSTEAGLDFIGAIQRISDKSADSVLAQEFGKVLQDIKLGSARGEALKKMSDRLDIPEITSFVAVIVDADKTGASIASVLKDQSEQMRLERFVRAEKAGARASQLIMLPMMVFILPAVFLMVFGPVALSFMGGGN